jgi:hypothetical protein
MQLVRRIAAEKPFPLGVAFAFAIYAMSYRVRFTRDLLTQKRVALTFGASI